MDITLITGVRTVSRPVKDDSRSFYELTEGRER
jgi:hypothetical protein